MIREPATEAGRRLLRRYDEEWPEKFDISQPDILAIEGEARAASEARVAKLEAALREAYTLLVSAEPTLIRPHVSLRYKAFLRDKVAAWLELYRNNFDAGLDTLAAPEARNG